MVKDPLEHISAKVSGAAGGATAGLGQFIGTTFNDTIDHVFAGEVYAAMNQACAFLIGTTLMAVAGAVVAFFLQSKTQSRWALFLAGAAATSIGTTALPGLAKLVKRVDLDPISISYAQIPTPYMQPSEPGLCPSTSVTISTSLRQFFGFDDGAYRVVVGSFKNSADAQTLANKINAADNSFHAFVGPKAPGNDFFPVIVGPVFTTLDDAKRIQNRVLSLDFIPGAYISRRNC
jgi:SPOR domain